MIISIIIAFLLGIAYGKRVWDFRWLRIDLFIEKIKKMLTFDI